MKQRTINAFLGRDATTAVSQLQWSQSLKHMFTKIVKLYMTIKNNNEDGSGGFPGSWVIHKSDAKSKKIVIRKLLQAAAANCR